MLIPLEGNKVKPMTEAFSVYHHYGPMVLGKAM